MTEIWFTAKEAEGLPGLPETHSGIKRRAERENWTSRNRSGRGGGLEYHISVLHYEAQAELKERLLPTIEEERIAIDKARAEQRKQTSSQPDVQSEIATARQTLPAVSAETETLVQAQRAADGERPRHHYDKDSLWSNWERKSNALRNKALKRVRILDNALDLIAQGMSRGVAFEQAAKSGGVSRATLYRWNDEVQGYDRPDWAAVLIPHYLGNQTSAECSPEAWDYFKADYLRLEKTSANVCYFRLQRVAEEKGWAIPSVKTLQRRLKEEIPRAQLVLLREGEQALLQLYPSLERSVRDLHAMEWINGDGYQHNVFVLWPDGSIARPKTWFWQDVYSRRLLAWRTDLTENTDVLRQSFGCLVEKYGIPSHATIDNTRAAANKWMTGGVANRYRFKIKEDDPMGIMTVLGVKVHWTSVFKGKGHGQAKPVERVFGVGGLGEHVDKDPAFRGAYTGANSTAKPENYGERAIDLDTFLHVLDDRIKAFNAMPKRRTEICAGMLSFDQAFNESYSRATIRKATYQQRRMWLLAAESIRVSKHGTVTLEAGAGYGKGKNRYGSDALLDHAGQKVVVRFDPQALHSSVYVDTLDGLHICEADCLQAAGFGDTQIAREHNRARKQFVKSNKEAANAQVRMDALEAAAMIPESSEPEVPHSAAVEGTFKTQKKAAGTATKNRAENTHETAPASMQDSFISLLPAMRKQIQEREDEKL